MINSIIPQIHISQNIDTPTDLQKFDHCVKETLSLDGSPDLDRASLLYNERFKPSNEGPGYSPDSETVEYCNLMFSRLKAGEVLEVRAVKSKSKSKPPSHIVKDPKEAASILSRLNNGKFEKVCMTANPASNVTGAVKDTDITRRLWLGFDIDHPGKKIGEPPFWGHLVSYESVCLAVFRGLGWSHAFKVFSGNGFRVFYACDVPATEEMNHLVKDLYSGLKKVIDSKVGAEVFDNAVHNLSRIWAAPGTDNGSCGRTVTHEQTDPSTWTILTEADIRAALAKLNKPAEEKNPLAPSVEAPKSRKANNDEFLPPSDPETSENRERVKSALSSLDPDMSYDGWMNILRALKSLPWVCAKELAREWSAKGSKWDEAAFEDKWEYQIKPDGGISIGTLFHLAKEKGWVDPALSQSGRAIADEGGESRGKKKGKTPEYYFVESASRDSYARADKSLYQWTGKFWRLVDEEDIKGKASQFLIKRFPSDFTASKITSCANVLAACAPPLPNVPEGESEAIIPLQSGYLHVSASGEVVERKHDSGLGIKYCLPISYRPGAPEAQFLKFLGEVLPDESDRLTIQEFFGYSLIRSKRYHKGMIFDGDGRNGKGVLLNLLKALHYKNASINLDNLRGFGLENGLDASLLSCPELPKKNFDSELFKSIVAEDEINVDRKHKKAVSASLPGKLVILTNGLPTLTDRSAGFWARLLIIQFKVSFVGREDTGLEKRIRQTELPAILNWAVAGLVRLLQNGRFTEGESLRRAVETARLESDPIRLFIHDKGAAIAENTWIGKDDIFGRFQMWSEHNGFAKCNNVTFWKRFRSVFPELREKDRKGGGREVNIKISPE